MKSKPENLQRFDLFEKLLKEGKTLKEAKSIAKIATGTAYKIINSRNLKKFVRTRKQAAMQDKAISLEEANSRIPAGNGIAVEYGTFGKNISKFKIITEDGFIYYKSRIALRQGDPRNKSGTKTTIDKVKSILLDLGYDYIDGWTSKRNPLKAKHIVCGNVRENRLINFKNQQCPKCAPAGTSGPEIEIREWIKSLGIEVESFVFPTGKTRRKSLDIYIPSLKLGIEHDGLYFHSVEGLKRSNKNYTDIDAKKHHIRKMKLANDLGIRVIFIRGDEWKERSAQVKNFLKSVLNKNEHIVFARKTEVKYIDQSVAKTFIELNHIQGCNKAPKYSFGLFYNDLLVGVMSFDKHQRDQDNSVIVLSRLCFLEGYRVQGGASKLICFAKKILLKNGYKKLISWSDNRISNGDVYKALNFELEAELPEDYSYVKGDKLYSKQSMKKTTEERKTDKTEFELRKDQGYLRIYDCGKKRWIINLK